MFRNVDTDDDIYTALLQLWGLPAIPGDGYSVYTDRRAAILRHVHAAPDTDLGVMVLQVLITADLEFRWNERNEKDYATPAIDILAQETGVDVARIQRESKAAQKAAAKEAAEAAKATAAPPGAKVQAAPRGSVTREGAGKPGAKKAAGARGKRLTEEEAKSGIADAMQGVDEPGAGVTWPEGLDTTQAEKLLAAGVGSIDDLANLTIDELSAITGQDSDAAKAVIMKARAEWLKP